MQNEIQNIQPQDDEINLSELGSILWAGKKIIISVATLCTLMALVFVLLTPNQYKSTVVVSPAQGGNKSMLGSMATKIGGLASLAGINVSGSEGIENQAAMEILQSWSFIEQFISNNNLEAEVFAVEGWNRETNKLRYDSGLFDSQQNQWVRNPPVNKTVKPTSWELYKVFSEYLTVSIDSNTGLISISIEYYSPVIAKQWLDIYISAINDHMRVRKLEQVNSNIEYLEAQIEKTAIAGMKEIFYQIIEEQIKNKMLAEASPEYAFVTISPAMTPEEKSSPKRALICMLALLLGIIVSIFTVLIMHYSNQSDSHKTALES